MKRHTESRSTPGTIEPKTQYTLDAHEPVHYQRIIGNSVTLYPIQDIFVKILLIVRH